MLNFITLTFKVMKKIKITVSLISALIIFSGSAWVNLTLMRPSEIMLPEHIRTIAIIDRSVREESKAGKMETIITGEFFKQDEQAVFNLTEGFINACAPVSRYITVRTSEKYKAEGSMNSFPEPVDWYELANICQRYGADAVMSIEYFDSDFIMTNIPVSIAAVIDPSILLKQAEYRASGLAVINLGIRIYDPSDRVILDEYQTTYKMNFEGYGTNLQDAINHVIDKTEAIKRAGYEAGEIYGSRITPTYYRVTRYFYNKPGKLLGPGVRMSEVAEWTGAIEAWNRVVETGKRKHAGRAALNIAVGYEVLGDLELAREWAAKSYVDYKEKMAEDYYDVLMDRIRSENIAEQQLTKSE